MTVRKNHALGAEILKKANASHHTITITHINTVSDPQTMEIPYCLDTSYFIQEFMNSRLIF